MASSEGAAATAAPCPCVQQKKDELALPAQPVLTLSKCILRPYQESDAAALAKEADNPLVPRYRTPAPSLCTYYLPRYLGS